MMKEEKILFLTKGKRDNVVCGQYGENVWAIPVYRYENALGKACAQIFSKINVKLAALFLGSWATHIENYDVVICEGLKARTWVFEYLKRITKNCKCRIVMWHWNPISIYEVNPKSPLGQSVEQWSFDEVDCHKFGMRFNTQYFCTLPIPRNCEEYVWDVYFLGADKGRKTILERFQEQCREYGINTYLHVTSGVSSSKNQLEQKDYQKPISYKENLENDTKTKAILEVLQSNQSGLTLRTLEALYLGKKLITTNHSVKNLSFYDEDNILIYDNNVSGQMIRDFLDIPYHETQKNIEAREYYSFFSWARRFGRTEDCEL